MLSRARLAFVLRLLHRRHARTLWRCGVWLWIVCVVLALVLTAVLLIGELVLYGFRDRPGQF